MNPGYIAPLTSILLFLGMLIVTEAGFRSGRRWRANHPNESASGVGVVEGAVLALLGLLLAFTFSAAASRLDLRRGQIVQEANAIGTAYLRVDLLSHDAQAQLRPLFRNYVDARISVYDNMNNQESFQNAMGLANQLQNDIWNKSVAACLSDAKSQPCLLLLPALNEMIDITTSRSVAMRTHTPAVIVGLLLALSMVSALLVGFAMSEQERRSVLHIVLFSVAIAVSVYTVLDLEYPRHGLINLRKTDSVFHQLRDSMK